MLVTTTKDVPFVTKKQQPTANEATPLHTYSSQLRHWFALLSAQTTSNSGLGYSY